MKKYGTKEEAITAAKKAGKGSICKINNATWMVFPSGSIVGLEKKPKI